MQRPANAIKELLENSLDAGATKIQVLIKDGGSTLMQVIDNGKGMSETDVRLCWERHGPIMSEFVQSDQNRECENKLKRSN